MENGEPLPSYEGIAAAFAKAKADKERDEARGLRATTRDAEIAQKQGEVHFKAAHGIVIAFFTWLLYKLSYHLLEVSIVNNLQYSSCPWHLPLHDRLPPHPTGLRSEVRMRAVAHRCWRNILHRYT